MKPTTSFQNTHKPEKIKMKPKNQHFATKSKRYANSHIKNEGKQDTAIWKRKTEESKRKKDYEVKKNWKEATTEALMNSNAGKSKDSKKKKSME